MFLGRPNKQCNRIDEADIDFYAEFKDLTAEEKSSVCDIVHLMHMRKKRKEVAEFVLALVGMLFLIAILTTAIQRYYSVTWQGRLLYASTIKRDLSSLLLVPGVHLLLRTSLAYLLPCAKVRNVLRICLIVLSPIMVVSLPTVLLLTIGEIACWDVAVVDVASALVMLSWSDKLFHSKRVHSCSTQV